MASFVAGREGRTERIPINDASVIFIREQETKTWFGANYTTRYVVLGPNTRCMKKVEVLKHIPLSYYEELAPIKAGMKYDLVEIPSIHAGDYDRVCKEINRCRNCDVEVINDNRHNITKLTLDDYRRLLNNDSITFGRACNKCYHLYYQRKMSELEMNQ